MDRTLQLPKEDRLLRIVDIQERCNVSRSKAYDMLSKGLKHLKIGSAVRVRESVLEEYLRRCEVD